MHEWALLIFTISMQAAIGGMAVLWFFHRKVEGSGENSYNAIKIPLIVITVLSIVGLAASFFHLGKPTHAFNTILGFGHSWMSREIVFTGTFIALTCVTLAMFLIQKKANTWMMLITAVVGLVDVYAMAAIYSSTLVDGWGHINTFLSFYGTTLTLGAILMVSLKTSVLKNKNLINNLVKIGFYVAAAGIAVQLIGTGMYAAFGGEVTQIAGTPAAERMAGYQGIIAARWIIEIAGIGLLGYYAISSVKKISYTFTYAALAAILVAEGMSRYVFYLLG